MEYVEVIYSESVGWWMHRLTDLRNKIDGQYVYLLTYAHLLMWLFTSMEHGCSWDAQSLFVWKHLSLYLLWDLSHLTL